MASNDVNLGIGLATGMFYTAPAGTALPATPSTTPGSAWTDAGAITADGITWSTGKDSEPLRNWAKETERLVASEEGGTVTAPMMYTTYAIAIDKALAGELTPEVIEKLEALKASLAKKSGAERKPTAKQTENAAVRATLVDFINENFAEGSDGFTVSDLLKECPAVEGKSNQYVSALLRQAVLAGEVSKGTVKRRTYFAPIGVYAPIEG